MNSIQKRFLLFLGLCIPTRLLLVYISKIVNLKYLRILGIITLLPAIGFLYLYFSGNRQTGLEVFGGKIWWTNLRIYHGLFYLIFSILAIFGVKNAWILLLIDTLFGLISFLIYHYIQKNFIKLKLL